MEQTDALDIWTVVHALSGVALAALGANRTTAYGLTIGVEIVELLLRNSSDFFKESPANVAADFASTIGAYELTRFGSK